VTNSDCPGSNVCNSSECTECLIQSDCPMFHDCQSNVCVCTVPMFC
jgi:hypothetical protein